MALTQAFPAVQGQGLAGQTSLLAKADTRTALPPASEWVLTRYADPVEKEKQLISKCCLYFLFFPFWLLQTGWEDKFTL